MYALPHSYWQEQPAQYQDGAGVLAVDMQSAQRRERQDRQAPLQLQ